MNIIKLFGITFLAFYITTGCTTDSSGLSNPIVKNSIDSICELLKPRRDSKVESVYIDRVSSSMFHFLILQYNSKALIFKVLHI